MIYTVFVEHTSSIRSFAKIATTNKQKAQKVFDEMCQYFINLAGDDVKEVWIDTRIISTILL